MFGSSKIISRLDGMLDDAINGNFIESCYDESEFSKLESKFRQYLTAKEVSAKNAEAERAAIKSLVTDISHQTKTPIANMHLYTQLLEEQCTQESLIPFVQQIRMQTEKLDFLIQALVKISRLESGVVEVSPSLYPVSPLIEHTAKLAYGLAAKKNINLEIIPAQTDASALYDERWTKEALGNLLDNAIKYSPPESTVTVSVRAHEMFVCICVADEGEKIPEEECAKIFERFYRGKNALPESGNGVGLYLTRMILQKEGGYVKAVPGEQCGNCFEMYLRRDSSY